MVARPCIYREQILIDRPLTLLGQPGSELRGSDVWGGWTKRTDGRWVSKGMVPVLVQDGPEVVCMPDTIRCKLPEQVFFDGSALVQATSLPTRTGQFYVNSDRRVILKRDPTGHTVEVTTRQHWVLGTSEADGVTIDGFTMKHAGTEGRSAALMNKPDVTAEGGDRWIVRNSTLTDGHSAIISLSNAPSHRIVGNKILRGGMLGIKGSGPQSIIRSNEIAYGNTELYCYAAACGLGEAGGVKFAAHVRDTVFDQNVVHDNFGKGVHYDIECSGNTASDNRIYDNARMGLHMELCYSGKVFGNVIYDNGSATPEDGKGVGLAIHASENIEVYDNVIAYNPGGIEVLGRDRVNHTLVHNVFVHDNTIIMQDGYTALLWRLAGGGDMFAPSANNRGSDNLYYYPVAENQKARFGWNGPILRLSAFNLTLGEERGRYLTGGEKDAVLTTNGIPARP